MFDVDDFWHHPGTLNDGVGEMAGVTLEVTVVDLADTNGTLKFFVSDLEKDSMVAQGGVVEVVLQHDDVQLVEDCIRVLSLEGANARGYLCLGMSWGIKSGRL